MSPRSLSRLGIVGGVTGILGALSAVLMLAWPAQSPESVLSYPFTTTGFHVIQGWFAVHHLGLLALLVGLASSSAHGWGRAGRAFAWLAVVGMVLLTGMELFAMQFAEWDTKAANEGIMGAGYGVATNVVGLGLLGAGVGVIRARVWTGWRRFIPLALGVTLFLVVTPAMFSGYVIARLAIGSWMALFAALGWALMIESRQRL